MSQEQSPDDFELLNAWCRGDRRAGGVLVARHYASVESFFRARARAGFQEDLVQETFLACTKNAAQFRGGGPFRAFLLGIARIVLASHLRREGVRNSRLGVAVELDEDQAAAEPSPAMMAARHELQQRLLEALRRIPVAQQIVVGLHYWSDHTVAEIGELLCVPLGTAKTRLLKGRAHLKAHYRALVRSRAAIEPRE